MKWSTTLFVLSLSLVMLLSGLFVNAMISTPIPPGADGTIVVSIFVILGSAVFIGAAYVLVLQMRKPWTSAHS